MVTISNDNDVVTLINVFSVAPEHQAALMIELSGPSVGPGQFVNGLKLSGANASNSVIRGLVINGFSSDGIRASSGASCRVEGNFIGTDPSGTVDEGNHTGVDIGGNSTIGGTSPAERNLISGNDFSGVTLTERGNKIEGNLIGTNINGTKTPNRWATVTVCSLTPSRTTQSGIPIPATVH